MSPTQPEFPELALPNRTLWQQECSVFMRYNIVATGHKSLFSPRSAWPLWLKSYLSLFNFNSLKFQEPHVASGCHVGRHSCIHVLLIKVDIPDSVAVLSIRHWTDKSIWTARYKSSQELTTKRVSKFIHRPFFYSTLLQNCLLCACSSLSWLSSHPDLPLKMHVSQPACFR